jgi:peroxiredoxin
MLENRENQNVPHVIFRARREHEWVDVTSDEIFKGRTVVVFSLPGAFTPTCSSTHVPRYNQLAPLFKRHGVDEVICISVNDAFVMNEWQLEQKADRITFLPDGNGDFTRGMGMLRDAGIEFEELVLNKDYSESSLRAVAGVSMVPQVFINGERIGGSDELEAFLTERQQNAA